MAFDMKKIREMSPSFCEMFDRDAFADMLKRRGLAKVLPYIDMYVDAGWLKPLEVGSKVRFHRGHMLILFQLSLCNELSYQSGLNGVYDFEDVLSRRVCLCEINAKNVYDDACRIQQLFQSLWGSDDSLLQPINAVLVKAILDISLDDLDPDGFYETLRVEDGTGTYKLVKDLLQMQVEVSRIIGMISSTGASLPNVQYIFDRKRRYDELSELFLPIQSQFLAVPSREIMADERLEFMRERNRLLAESKYQELVDYYESHLYYYESDVELHGRLCVCLGHLYGDLLKNSAKAAEAFQEALEYDPSNSDAFKEISHHMREAEEWPELVELLSNHWDAVDDVSKRCELILECAQIEAFKCRNIDEALGLYERCMIEGHPGNDFDNLYKIIAGLMDDRTDLEKLRALVTLTMHVVNFSQCDKLSALKDKYGTSDEPLGRALAAMVDAGIESFKGDQPEALEILCDAAALAPSSKLLDGLLYRIASKINSISEFREGLSSLETQSITSEDLSDMWLRVAKVLMNLGNHEALALEYAEKALTVSSSSSAALELSYDLAQKLGCSDKIFVYATVRAARTQNSKLRSELENICEELKISIADDDDKLMGAYEMLLQFDDVREETGENIRDLANNLDTPKAVLLLQRVESRCMTAGMSDLVSELYQIVLDRVVTTDQKKGLLERYIGVMLGQGADLDIDEFIPVHAQLFVLAPSDRLFTMLKTAVGEDVDAIRNWAGLLEDAVCDIDDTIRVAKIHTTLADCYQNIIKDYEKAADAFANLLKAAPDNVPAFKCCYGAFERLERYFECTEICKAFPLERLNAQERFSYAVKSLTYALISLYDANTMQFFVDVIAREDESRIPSVVDMLLSKADAGNLETNQLICFFQQLEEGSSGLTALTFKIERANLLAKENELNSAADILSRETYEAAVRYNIVSRAKSAVEKLSEDPSPEYQTLAKCWRNEAAETTEDLTETADTVVSDTSAAAAASISALVKECAENLEDESFEIVIRNALSTLAPADATSLCVQLGNLYESAQFYPKAEEYYKKAFKYTQSFELLEFYKRCRMFKKALKIATFKLSKAADADKNAVRLELAMIYESMGAISNAIDTLDELIASKTLDKTALIAILRQKSTCYLVIGQSEKAIEALRLASAEADVKTREEIDTDICFLMREISSPDAKKLHQSLMLRGVRSDKMTLLNLCFDIDADKFNEAAAKIDTLLKSDSDLFKIPALEQKIRLQKKRGDAGDEIRATAQQILLLSPENAVAKGVIDG